MKISHLTYFFVKDRVDSKEVVIEHCRTEEMLADVFIKPLQGAAFCKFQNAIMGVDGDMPSLSSVLRNEGQTGESGESSGHSVTFDPVGQLGMTG